MLGGVAGLQWGRERWTIPYISRGRFMEIRSGDPLDTMIGGLDTIEIAAPVPYVSATFFESHAGAMDGGEACGSLAVPPLNMEELQEITIRRVRSGLGEFRCHVNDCLYAVSEFNYRELQSKARLENRSNQGSTLWERVSLRDRLNRISNNDISIHSDFHRQQSELTISMLNQFFYQVE